MNLLDQRQRSYLRLLELPLWQPRRPLPGARQPLIELPEAELPESVAADPLHKLILPPMDLPAVAPALQPEPVAAAEFVLYYRRLPHGWLLLCDLEAPQLGLQQRRLFDNILFALGSEEDPAAEGLLQWPPKLPGIKIDPHPREAVRYLDAFISSQQEREGVTHLLCFGAKSLQLLSVANEAGQLELGSRPYRSTAGELTLVVTHSLSELLREPQHKAASWRHLRSLQRQKSAKHGGQPD